MMAAIKETGKAVNTLIGALRREPLSLALVVMNFALLVFFYVMLSISAAEREREIGLIYSDKKDVRELLAKCVVPYT